MRASNLCLGGALYLAQRCDRRHLGVHETNPIVDRAVETMFTRFTDHVDTCIKALKQELKAELAAHFDPLHHELSERMATVEDRVDKASEIFDRWALEIRKDTGITKLLAANAFANADSPAPPPETPQPGDPRPMEIDHAVAADPADGAQRVDLPECGAVIYPKPGTDASTAWDAAGAAIRAGRMR
jgi:hypothetical protein